MSIIDVSRFKPIELADRRIFEDKFKVLDRRSCECNFNNLFFWSTVYDERYTEIEDRLLVCAVSINEFMFPVGEFFPPERLAKIIGDICSDPEHCGWIYDVPEKYIMIYDAELRKYFEVETSEDYYDYIYSAEALAELHGERLNKKRNLISQFETEYPDAFSEPLTEANADSVLEFALRINKLISNGSDTLDDEKEALVKTLEHFSGLNAEGLVLKDGNDIIAFAIFSRTNSDTYDIHFEKADREYKGASQVINQQTAELIHQRGIKYINREQDLGLPGLRQAKHSYEPEFLLKRYRLRLR